ncbi:ankyrin repeat domain-containing protein [Defluviimonas sp. WL0024]|uniref:Ankyrin repeat domain-containing protein n=1 Tax=Albidovulum salinarum TaxID=2984153 RepID=A0ABT2X108_9RHOB|nr:ankyrin repeat domain-containing protein [Defluviimonas sp. WL0024]MCU9847616.1 ankyrin repeat domain-containing protein [Defluviimonas sp. WL0024]
MRLHLFTQLRLLCLAVLLPGLAVAQDLVPLASSGDMPALKAALPEGSKPDPDMLVKPLYFAAQRGQDEAVSYLLSVGAEPDSATDFGTALGIAARNNHTGIVAALLAAGADPNLPGGEYGMMPLHQAAERGAIEAARLLLENGADVNAGTARLDWPAIQFAGSKDQAKMVAFLRDMGAGPAPVEALKPGELEAADPEEGRVLAIECGGCHGMTPGEAGSGQHPGPNLVGVVDRAKASADGFPYSKEMQAQTGSWTPEELNVFLADPHNVVPGTTMTGGRQPDRAARVAIIAHLVHLAP